MSRWETLGAPGRVSSRTGGSPLCFPPLLGPVPAAELRSQREGLGLSQLRGLAALLLPGNRARGGAKPRRSRGCPCPAVYTHGGPTPAPPCPEPAGVSRSSPGVHCSARLAASPWPGVYLVLIYFPPFVDKRCWLPCSPPSSIFKRQSWKREVSPCFVPERNYK